MSKTYPAEYHVMSGTHHPRPSRKDILAELAQVKRERNEANERAADYDDVSLKLTKAWMELEMAGEKLTAAERRAEEAEDDAGRCAEQRDEWHDRARKWKDQRDDVRKKNAELAVFVEAFCEVCEAHAGTSGESVSDLLDKALELEMWPQ